MVTGCQGHGLPVSSPEAGSAFAGCLAMWLSVPLLCVKTQSRSAGCKAAESPRSAVVALYLAVCLLRSFAARSCGLLAPQNYIAQQRVRVVSLCKLFVVRTCRLLVLQSHLSRRRRLSKRALVQWLQHPTWMRSLLR